MIRTTEHIIRVKFENIPITITLFSNYINNKNCLIINIYDSKGKQLKSNEDIYKFIKKRFINSELYKEIETRFFI